MRPDEFRKLFEPEKIGKISAGIVRDVVYYLGMKGIRNEDVPRFVPFINDYLNTLTNHNKVMDHKNELKKIIDESALTLGVESLAEPVREENSPARQHRRMDSLARVLALSEADTPCIAVALVNNNVVMSFNSPIKSDLESVKGLLERKFKIVRDFLQQGSQLFEEGRLDEVMKLIATTRKAILASGSHSQLLLPTERRKRATMDKFLDVALGKLLTAVVKGPENGGFSDADRDAILIGDTLFLVPNTDIENQLRSSFHAEQVVASYITEKKTDVESIYVGISKLCCAACRDVLNDNPGVLFRGSHGMTFPNVIDTRSMTTMEYQTRTKLTGLSHADDSDSEPELDDVSSRQRDINNKGEIVDRLQQHSSRLFRSHANDKVYPPEENNENLPQGGIIAAVK